MGADCLSSTDITDAAGSSNSLRSKSSLSSSSVPSGDILAMQSRKQGQCSSQRDNNKQVGMSGTLLEVV